MFKNKKFSLIVIGALALTLALGLVAFAPVNTANAAEQANQEGPGGSDSTSGERGSRSDRGGRRGLGSDSDHTYLADALGITTEELQTAYEEARSNFEGPDSETTMDTLLAEALGISVDELTAARETAKEAAIEQALEDGNITEEQVAMMEAREALRNYMQKDEMLAKALGISVEELEASKEDGQSIRDLMEELGIEQEDFEANMQVVREEILQQAVEDGAITQEQADQMLENGFQGKRGHGERGGRPSGDKEGFEHPEGQPGDGEADGTNFQRPGRSTDEG